jgi:hypothetical protein
MLSTEKIVAYSKSQAVPLNTSYEQTVKPGDARTADCHCALKRWWSFNDAVWGSGTYVSSEVLKTVIIKITVFCKCYHAVWQMVTNVSEGEGGRFIRIFGTHLSNCMASQLSRP